MALLKDNEQVTPDFFFLLLKFQTIVLEIKTKNKHFNVNFCNI